MRPAFRTLQVVLATAIAWAAPAWGEIKHKVDEEGIVATNIRIAPRVPGRGRAGPLRAELSVPEEGPESPPVLADLLVGTSARYGFDPALIRAVVRPTWKGRCTALALTSTGCLAQRST